VNDATPETWRPIPRWEGLYEVSDLGRVRRLRGRNGWGYYDKVTVIKPDVGKQGYLMLNLWRDCKPMKHMVHRLVARAFLGPRPDGLEIRHLDDNKMNNTLGNLVYGTRSENKQDSVQNGIHPESNKTHCPAGHEYTPENTYRTPSRPNARFCRECTRRRNREFSARKKAKAKPAVAQELAQ